MAPALIDKRHPRRLARGSAFNVYVLGSVIAFAAAAAPTPLYDRMQQDWDFPSGMLTAAFSIYAVTLLLALLTTGSLSTYVGIRPVLVLGFAANAACMLLLCFAGTIEAVIAARGAQGAATGAVISAVGAGIVRLAPPRRASTGPTVAALAPQLGSAVGAVGAGAALALPLAPATVVFGFYAVLLFGMAVLSATLPDAPMKAGRAWKSVLPKVSIPRDIRWEFIRATPLILSGWMLGALYLSLVPVIVRATLGGQVVVMGGLATGLFCLVAAGSGGLCGHLRPQTTAIWGAFLMVAGALALATSLLIAQFSLFAIATVLSASGFGAANAGAFRLVIELAPERQRVELFSALYVVSYLAFGLPIAVTGGMVDAFGLTSAIVMYATAIAVLAFAGGASQLSVLQGPRASGNQRNRSPQQRP